MTKSDKAVEYFKNGFNCSQSVLAAFGRDYNISEDSCLRIACAFGGGMGRQQHTCGAVTGALMVLGLHYGKAMHEDDSRKLKTYRKTVEFFKNFKKRNDSVICKELLNGLDMNDKEDMKKIEELGLFKTNCANYVRDAVEITQKLINRK